MARSFSVEEVVVIVVATLGVIGIQFGILWRVTDRMADIEDEIEVVETEIGDDISVVERKVDIILERQRLFCTRVKALHGLKLPCDAPPP